MFLLVIRLPRTSTLFPYTTLFRSGLYGQIVAGRVDELVLRSHGDPSLTRGDLEAFAKALAEKGVRAAGDRSEEHTSELQSQSNLVCRLLLEKKNTRKAGKKHARYS